MKTFEIYPFGAEYPIVVRGNYASYKRSLEKGEYKIFDFEIVEIDEWLKMTIVHASNDRSSNRGHWFAHCKGYNMDCILRYNGHINVNTYHNYRKVSIKKVKNERFI